MVAFIVYDPDYSASAKPVTEYGDCPAEDVADQGGSLTSVAVPESQMATFQNAVALIESPLWADSTIRTLNFNPATETLSLSILSPGGMSARTVDTIRTQLLADSDWTQLLDAPLTAAKQAQWASYRQELRDIPAQPGYPGAVSWPVKPT